MQCILGLLFKNILNSNNEDIDLTDSAVRNNKTNIRYQQRIVPNNFSTNINVHGNFNVNNSYVCGIGVYTPHQYNLSRKSMVFTLPQKPHNSTYLLCEIPAVRVNLKLCSIF